jgi:hypothetical protein
MSYLGDRSSWWTHEKCIHRRAEGERTVVQGHSMEDGRRPRRTVVRLVAALSMGMLLATASVLAPPASAREQPRDTTLREAAIRSAENISTCAAGVNAEASDARQINLVIDDSGSMFKDLQTNETLDRWSKAKYALEVFAAMLDINDSLNVYRMSDFSQGKTSGPVVKLDGTQSIGARVKSIHDMQMQGVDTPFSSVEHAYSDLVATDSTNKWLVIITDGEFEDAPGGGAEARIRQYPGASDLRAAYLAIGADAPAIQNDPAHGIHFSQAPSSAGLLDEMTGFANLIFERNLLPSGAQPNVIDPDIDLSEVLVFAQGGNVKISDGHSAARTYPVESSVTVQWADNMQPTTPYALTATPDKTLSGVLARFIDVERGTTEFDITGASEIAYFYKPRISFGIELRDASGAVVDANRVVGGEYTLRYGFMDADCAFIDSPLIGDVDYSARAFSGDEVLVESFQSGDTISFDRGDIRLEVHAEYLGGNTSQATIDLTVLQPARPTSFVVDAPDIPVSELAEYANVSPITLTYGLGDPANQTPFTPEEWAAVAPEDFTIESFSNLDFVVELGDEVGQVLVTPLAPDGDVYAADTGEIPITVSASHVYDEQLYDARFDTSFLVADDISPWDRFVDWFLNIGWKLLIGLLLLILILGYIFKPRFSKKIKRNPTVNGVPMTVGMKPETGNGKFRVQTLRKYMPFVADQAALTYVPQGTFGFRALKLKAGRSGKMTLLNWKQIAEKKNVALNGNDLNEDTKRPPRLSASTNITATVPNQTRFELYLNS